MKATASDDVIVKAPAAIGGWHPPTLDKADLDAARLMVLEADIEKHKTASGTIANVALGLFVLLCEERGASLDNPIVINADLARRLKGCQLTVGQTGTGDVVVRARLRNMNPGWEPA